MQNREAYVEPDLKIIEIEKVDIVTTSNEDPNGWAPLFWDEELDDWKLGWSLLI